MPSRPKRAIVSVTNDLATDNRVHRTCMVLRELGYEVLLVGRQLPNSPPLERPYATKRMRLLFRKGPLFYAEYNVRLFLLQLSVGSCQLLVANDLDTLLANFLVARLRGIELVYDTHEFYTEVPELVGRPRVRAVWLAIERWIFPKLKRIITVNGSIAQVTRSRTWPAGGSLHTDPARCGHQRGKGRRGGGAGDERAVRLLAADHRQRRCLAGATAAGERERPGGSRPAHRPPTLRRDDALHPQRRSGPHAR
ncbi:MAG: glycosyltransferase [Flavobacteriales bacterium]|nr:glycosyltransferase [Flavobacteriales bacterium]